MSFKLHNYNLIRIYKIFKFLLLSYKDIKLYTLKKKLHKLQINRLKIKLKFKKKKTRAILKLK